MRDLGRTTVRWRSTPRRGRVFCTKRKLPRVLEDGLEFFGADRLVFATDYPFGPDRGRGFMREEVAGVGGMGVDVGTREAIYAGNLERLLR